MKKIIDGIKNEDGAFVKPVTVAPALDPKVSDISLDWLLGRHMLILYRETKSLLIESSKGKLNKDSSQSMRDNLKLIMDLKKQEKAFLDGLTDEEITELEKAL